MPYWSGCPSCVLSPAKTRPTLDPLEVQLDQYFYRGVKLIAIVVIATYCVGTATTFSGEARGETVRNFVKFLRSFGLKQVHLIYDGEPLVAAIAHETVGVTGGSFISTKASPSRHAPVAKRAIRTLKETASANELRAKGVNNLRLLANEEAMELLHVHAACSHNRFAASIGSMLCPLQRALGESYVPHLFVSFACVVYVQPPQHLASQVDGRYDIGSYLGPVVGGLGHHCMIRLANGSMKRCVARARSLFLRICFRPSRNLIPMSQTTKACPASHHRRSRYLCLSLLLSGWRTTRHRDAQAVWGDLVFTRASAKCVFVVISKTPLVILITLKCSSKTPRNPAFKSTPNQKSSSLTSWVSMNRACPVLPPMSGFLSCLILTILTIIRACLRQASSSMRGMAKSGAQTNSGRAQAIVSRYCGECDTRLC